MNNHVSFFVVLVHINYKDCWDYLMVTSGRCAVYFVHDIYVSVTKLNNATQFSIIKRFYQIQAPKLSPQQFKQKISQHIEQLLN